MENELNKQTIDLHEIDKIENSTAFIEYLNAQLKITKLEARLTKKDWEKHTKAPFNIVQSNDVTFVGVSTSELSYRSIELFQKYNELITTQLESNTYTTEERFNILKKQEPILKGIMLSYSQFIFFRFSDDTLIIEYYKNNKRGSSIHFIEFTEGVWIDLRKIYRKRFEFFEYLYDELMKQIFEYEELNSLGHKNYGWISVWNDNQTRTTTPALEIYELAYGLANSNKLAFYNGKDQSTFIKDFFSFFNLPINSINKCKSILSDRSGNSTPFIDEVASIVRTKRPYTERAKKNLGRKTK